MTSSGSTNSFGMPNQNAYVRIKTGKENDFVEGTSDFGTLNIYTGGGNDTTIITGVGGFASLNSAAGDDTNYIFNLFTKNVINAGAGNDNIILGGFGNENIVHGGKGNDSILIDGSMNNSKVYGDKGHDTFYVGNMFSQNNTTTIHGGKGYDKVVFEGPASSYQQGMVRENGKTYRTFTDANGNVTKVANDVENIQFAQPNVIQPAPEPIIQPEPIIIQPQPIPMPPPCQPEPNILDVLAGWMAQLMAQIAEIWKPAPPVAANETGTITGDPHFKGGDGGTYDVQGKPGKMYNLLSDKGLQFNGRFDAWGGGGATVVGETGLTVQGANGSTSNVTFDKTGKAKINGQELKDGQTVQLADGGTATKKGNQLIVTTAEGYTITQTAMSGGYINTEVKTSAQGVGADGYLPGGLLGQTFDADNIAKNGKKGAGAQGEGAIAGKVEDYEVGSLIPPAPMPSPSPTVAPSPSPTVAPSPSPTVAPSPSPTVAPSPSPTIYTPPELRDGVLSQTEMADLVRLVGGSDGKITIKELEAALAKPTGLTPDQRALGQELLKTMKTMEGSKQFGSTVKVSLADLKEMAEADGNAGTLSKADMAKLNSIWSTPGSNNDGQLGINEIFANDGSGKFNSKGFFGYFAKGDGKITEAELKDRLAHGAISPDERKIGEALLKYIQAEKAVGHDGKITAAELKNMMKADATGSNMTLNVADVNKAVEKLYNTHTKAGEKALTTYMQDHFAELDKDGDGFLNAAEIKTAGQASGATKAADTFVANMNLGPYGKGLIFESIDPTAAAWHGVSKADLAEIAQEQKKGKTLTQIAKDPF